MQEFIRMGLFIACSKVSLHHTGTSPPYY